MNTIVTWDCGTTTIINFILLGHLSLLAGIILLSFRQKISKKLFILIEILLFISFLLYTIQYEHYSCLPTSGGAIIKAQEYRLFPKNILPIKIAVSR